MRNQIRLRINKAAALQVCRPAPGPSLVPLCSSTTRQSVLLKFWGQNGRRQLHRASTAQADLYWVGKPPRLWGILSYSRETRPLAPCHKRSISTVRPQVPSHPVEAGTGADEKVTNLSKSQALFSFSHGPLISPSIS